MIRVAIRKARRAGVAAVLASLSVLPAGFAVAETADEFVARLNQELAAIGLESAAAGWTQATYITVDTQLLNARANERFLEYFSAAVEQARKFDGQPMSPSSRRALDLLRLGVSAPAPDDPLKRAELAKLAAGMEAKYGSATWCPQGPASCRNEIQLKQVLEQSRDYDELLAAWQGWHDAARPLRQDYVRFVELANEGARALGFADLGVMWRSGYDMPADEFTREAARLYGQVEPLYRDLHCYARGKLAQKYGADKVPAGQADSGAPARQHVGPAVGCDLRPAGALSRRQQPRRRCRAREAGLRRGPDDEIRGDVLRVDRVSEAAGDVLGTLDADTAARPGRAVPPERLAHGRQGGRAHQDVHAADAR